jgi:arginase
LHNPNQNIILFSQARKNIMFSLTSRKILRQHVGGKIHVGMRSMATSSTCSLISIPISLGQPFVGPDSSPRLLKDNGLLQLLGDCGWRVEHLPDVMPTTVSNDINSDPSKSLIDVNAKNCAQVGATSYDVHKQVYEEAKKDNFLLILGGDHCIPIGTISGIVKARPSTGVIWVDAHADINTPAGSGSGNMHGMPLAFLLGLVEKTKNYPSMEWFGDEKTPWLKPESLVYIGLRDLDSFEKKIIKKLNIKAYTMYDIDRLGIGKIMEEATEYLNNYENIHLSYDIDALDPVFAPHTGTAVKGGLTFREGNYICENLYNTGKLTSMELVEVNPSLHPHLDNTKTIQMALSLLGSTMGEKIL